MNRNDIIRVAAIGAAVGLLIQPILANNIPARDLVYLTPWFRLGIFLFFLIFAPVALWLTNIISRQWRSFSGLYQFAKFAAVGTLNSFIDIGVFNLETAWYGPGLLSNALFAGFKAISFVFATTNSFFWNKYWTFAAGRKTNAKEVTGFYSIALIGWVANVAVATLVKAFGPVNSHVWINLVAPLAGVAVSFAWNFVGYKYWVFKTK